MTRGRRREHYQWNMDIYGVPGVAGEAELLCAVVTFLKRVGITHEDVGVKVSSRAILSELLSSLGVADDSFAATCVVVDKLDKLPEEEILKQLGELGLDYGVSMKLLEVLQIDSMEAVKEVLGEESAAVRELEELFQYAEAYGMSSWLQLDLSVVRGLAYYTGLVFEGFDREGELRAIFGGGRYDRILSTFGGADIPACGFGFGDAVIMELLKVKGLLPSLPPSSVDVVVHSYNEDLRMEAMKMAQQLRGADVAVDVIMESKKMKWAFKHADRLGAKWLVLLAPDEYNNGQIRVKSLQDGTQKDVPIAELVETITAK